MPDATRGATATAARVQRTDAPNGSAEGAELLYTNVGARPDTRTCPCGRSIPMPPADHVGRRPRLCSRCKQTRRALTYIRAGTRILEALRDPEWDGTATR